MFRTMFWPLAGGLIAFILVAVLVALVFVLVRAALGIARLIVTRLDVILLRDS